SVAIKLAVASGHRDENRLTNLVFFKRHPGRQGRPLSKGEPGFSDLNREWLDIRDRLVRPALRQPASPPPHSSHPRPGPAPGGSEPIPPITFGLDTASVGGNRNPKWVQAKVQGAIRFAIIRSNWGIYPDSVFARDWPKIKEAGIVRGAYLFLRFPYSRY